MSEIIINTYSEDGICYPKISLNIRTIPCATTGVILDQYHLGESVIYDQVVITDKYTWISWTSGSGRRVYMTVKDQTTGERWRVCEDISGALVVLVVVLECLEYKRYLLILDTEEMILEH